MKRATRSFTRETNKTDSEKSKKLPKRQRQSYKCKKDINHGHQEGNVSINCDNLTSPYFNNRRIHKEFYQEESIQLSKMLLGKVLARKLPNGEILRGTIVETEAYPGTNIDPASHSYRGKITERTKAMFMEPGTSYVYIIHGIYNCFNISAKGEGSVCLIRGVEPLEDYESMHCFRQQKKKKRIDLSQQTSKNKGKLATEPPEDTDEESNSAPSASATHKRLKTYELAKGPGRLCIAFDIRRDNCDTLDLSTSDELWLEYNEDPQYNQKDSFEIESSTRVGIDSTPLEARQKLWRFFIKNNFSVSTAKPSLIKKALKL